MCIPKRDEKYIWGVIKKENNSNTTKYKFLYKKLFTKYCSCDGVNGFLVCL